MWEGGGDGGIGAAAQRAQGRASGDLRAARRLVGRERHGVGPRVWRREQARLSGPRCVRGRGRHGALSLRAAETLEAAGEDDGEAPSVPRARAASARRTSQQHALLHLAHAKEERALAQDGERAAVVREHRGARRVLAHLDEWRDAGRMRRRGAGRWRGRHGRHGRASFGVGVRRALLSSVPRVVGGQPRALVANLCGAAREEADAWRA
jgi:hypothetical protein